MSLLLWSVVSGEETARQWEASRRLALQRMIATVNAGDAAGYARLYSDDAEITILGGEVIKGRSAVERYEASLMQEYPGTRLAFYSVWHTSANTVVHYGVNGMTRDGRPMGHEGLFFLRFDRFGAIAEERRYLDSLTPMAQLGAFRDGPVRPLPTLPSNSAAYTSDDSRVEKDNARIVRTFLAAIDSHKQEAAMQQMAATVSIDELMLPKALSGRPNAQQWFDTWSAVDDLKIAITNSIAVADHVLVETVTSGRLSRPLGRLTASATPFAVHRAFIFQIQKGRITRIVSFMNGKELAEETGQWPLR